MSFLEYFALLQIMGVTGASCNVSKYITPSRMISRTCCSTDGHRYDCGINVRISFCVLRQPSTFDAWVKLDRITISLTEISRHDNYKMFTFDRYLSTAGRPNCCFLKYRHKLNFLLVILS